MRCSDGAILTRSDNLSNTVTTVRRRTYESDDGKIKMNNYYPDHNSQVTILLTTNKTTRIPRGTRTRWANEMAWFRNLGSFEDKRTRYNGTHGTTARYIIMFNAIDTMPMWLLFTGFNDERRL